MSYSSQPSQTSSTNVELYYHPPAYRRKDVICPGSDDGQTPEEVARKRRRYEVEARRVAAGLLPVLQSASLRGPLSTAAWNWRNPWAGHRQLEMDDEIEETGYEEEANEHQQVDNTMYEDELDPGPDQQGMLLATSPEDQKGHNSTVSEDEEWWKPGSEEMLFTRTKVLKKAARHGMGHLAPREALLWCKDTAAEEALRQESVGEDILMSTEHSDTEMDEDLLADHNQDRGLPSSFLVEPNSSRFLESQMPELNTNELYSGQRAEQDIETKAKKRPVDPQWLKGSHESKCARWEDGPVSTPTPLPGAVERVRRNASQKLRPDSTPRTPTKYSPPATMTERKPSREYALQGKQIHVIKGSSFKYQKTSKPEPNLLDNDPEDFNELSGGSRYSPQSPKSWTSNPSGHQFNVLANNLFSDFEDDGLVVVTPHLASTISVADDEDLVKTSNYSTKLPRLPLVPGDTSFVTEEAPSSRNVEKFKFRKKKRRSTETQAADQLDPDARAAPSEPANDSSTRVDHTVADMSHHAQLLEAFDDSTLEARYSTPRSNKLSEISWDFMAATANAPASTPRRKRTLAREEPCNDRSRPLIAAILRSSPPLPTAPRISSPKLSSRSPLLTISRSRADTTKSRQSSSSLGQQSLKRDCFAGLLPKFDWEDDRSAMERIQKSLSQNYPSSSSGPPPAHAAQIVKDDKEISEEAASGTSEHAPEQVQEELVQGISHSGFVASQEDMQKGRETLSDDTDEDFAVIAMPQRAQSQSSGAAKSFPTMGSSASRRVLPSPGGQLFDLQSQEPQQGPAVENPEANLDVFDTSFVSSELHTADFLPQVVASSRSQPRKFLKPMASMNQNDISTQSYNTTPSGSRRLLLSSQNARSQLPIQPKIELATEDEEEDYSVLEDEDSLDLESESGHTSALDHDEPLSVNPNIVAPKLDRSRGSTLELAANLSEKHDPTLIEADGNVMNPKPDFTAKTPNLPVSEASWQGCGPQSPWAAEPSQRLPLSNTVQASESLMACNDREEAILANKDVTPRQNIVDSNMQDKRRLATPLNNLAKSFVGVKTPVSAPRSRRKQPNDKQTSSQRVLGTVTKNPWMSCLKNKSSGKARSHKRVSFGILPLDHGDGFQSQQASGSPPPPDQESLDDGTHDEDSPMVNKFENHFLAARRFTQILPDHVHSQDANSSPALGAQAEAFITADREISAEQEHEQEQPEDSLARFLQPRSNASENATWGNHEREGQSPFQEEPDLETAHHAPDDALENFDMDAALAEIGDFLTADWSVEDEMQKIKEATGAREQEDTGYRRRRLFGLA